MSDFFSLLSSNHVLCPHFGRCGGCRVQDLQEEEYKDYKLQKVLNPLQNLIANTQVHIHPFYHVSPSTRRRAVLKAHRSSKKVDLGFYQRESHHIVDLETCLIVVPEIEKLLSPLKEFLKEFLKDLLSIHSKAEIFILKSDQGLDISIETKASAFTSLSYEQREISADFARSQNLARLIVDQDPVYIQQTPTLSFEGMPVQVSPHVFLQASTESDQWLAQKVCDAIPEGFHRIADLFCGRGTLTLPLSKKGTVEGFEMDREALSALDKTALAFQRPLKTYFRNLFKEPLQASELKKYDVVILNPPREGAYAQSKQLALSNPSKIIYVSCNPKTFARDAKALVEGGFTFRELYPFDQFLWSDHMELVAVFDR